MRAGERYPRPVPRPAARLKFLNPYVYRIGRRGERVRPQPGRKQGITAVTLLTGRGRHPGKTMALNDAQNLFTLFFAIYFGMMIGRSHDMYRPWETYHAWRGRSHNIRRLITAWIILFIVPLVQFGILYSLLGSVSIPFSLSIGGISNIVLIGFGSFFEFGYFRIYEAFLHGYPESFFAEEELPVLAGWDGIRPDFRAHFMPGILYVIVSILAVLVAIYF